MNHPELQRLTGDTLEIMRILERTEPDGDCIIWTGAVGNTGHPIYKPTGCRVQALVRREVFRLGGRTLIARKPIDTKCNDRLCVNDAHLIPSTISKIAQKAAKRGAFSSPVKAMKIAMSKRGKMKLTEDQAREIRSSTDSGEALAERYGVDKSYAKKIKRGTAWKDYSSPFAGLLMRAA